MLRLFSLCLRFWLFLDWIKPFKLQVHTSNVGPGSVLLQTSEDGVDCVVGYFSKKFNVYQFNYSVIEKEALALIWSLIHFEVYVLSVGGQLVFFLFFCFFFNEHNPLTFLHS